MQPELLRPYSEVVWFQTEMLEPPVDESQLRRYQTAFAYLLTKDTNATRKFPRRKLAATDAQEMARLDAMKAAVSEGVTEPPKLAAPIPTAIALWPIDPSGAAVGDLPTGSGWVSKTTVKFKFRDRSGEHLLGYFERDSALGVLEKRITSTFAKEDPPSSQPRPWIGGALAAIGFVLFILAMSGAMETGVQIAQARAIVSSSVSDVEQRFSNAVNGLCAHNASLCDSQTVPEIVANCRSELAPLVLNGDQKVALSKLCTNAWNAALVDSDRAPGNQTALQEAGAWVIDVITFMRQNGTTLSQNTTISVVEYFLVNIFAMIVFFAGIGLWLKGRVIGVVINSQMRVSLSLMQITAWTVVILSAYATYCAFNVGAMGARSSEVAASDSLFPALKDWIWGVMGITIGSPFAAALIKDIKPKSQEEADDPEFSAATVLGTRLMPLSQNLSVSEAKISDIFLGEDSNTTSQLDISRTQNVVITTLLLFTFFGWLIQVMSAINMSVILTAFVKAGPVLETFPDPGVTFVALLGLTHSAYLAGKLRPGK